jgi:hypothetical protein
MIIKKQITTIAIFAAVSVGTVTAQANTVFGSAIGAAVGSAIGQQANGRDGAVIGGAIGGAIGAAAGHDYESNHGGGGLRTRVVYEEREVHHHHNHYYHSRKHHHPRGHAYGYWKKRPIIIQKYYYGSNRFDGYKRLHPRS